MSFFGFGGSGRSAQSATARQPTAGSATTTVTRRAGGVTRSSAKTAELAEKNKGAALAFFYYSAFGFQLGTACSVVEKMINAKDWPALVFVATASVQVQGNVTFVGDQWDNLAKEYPELIIESERDVGHKFNFHALRICGHLFCNIAKAAPEFNAALKKAGDCVFGGEFPDTIAGQLNAKTYKQWGEVDKGVAQALVTKYSGGAYPDMWKRLAVNMKKLASQFMQAFSDSSVLPAEEDAPLSGEASAAT